MVVPRQRQVRSSGSTQSCGPRAGVILNAETIRAYFDYPLGIAARSLGVCATSLKRYLAKMVKDIRRTSLIYLFRVLAVRAEKLESNVGLIARLVTPSVTLET